MRDMGSGDDKPLGDTSLGAFDPEEPMLDFGEAGSARASRKSSDNAKIVLKRVSGWRSRYEEWRDETSRKLERVDLAPDLAQNIGSGTWFRGLGTMLGLGAVALLLWPDFAPLRQGLPWRWTKWR